MDRFRPSPRFRKQPASLIRQFQCLAAILLVAAAEVASAIRNEIDLLLPAPKYSPVKPTPVAALALAS
jgi:hypothetical protein